jgi:DNA polymerase alpha subunit A
LYDEVTEEQYKSIVKGRLQQDDFVVDDGFGEYMDNGMEEDWGGANEEEEEEQDSADERERRRKGAFCVRCLVLH